MSELPDVIMCHGFPGSGKSTYTRENYPNAIIISNDLSKTALKDFETALRGSILIVIDNTNLTADARKKYLDIATKYSKIVDLIEFNSTIEDCQIRVLHRQWQKYGKLFLTGRIEDGIKDSHIFPPVALFNSRNNLEKPIRREGIRSIRKAENIDPKSMFSSYPNKAVFFDIEKTVFFVKNYTNVIHIDGTLRQTEHLPNKYPIKPEQVVPYTDVEKMKVKIDSYRKDGYLFFGVSNQSGIHKGVISEEDCIACMERTKEMLDFTTLPISNPDKVGRNECKGNVTTRIFNAQRCKDIEIKWCNHRSSPIGCYCRKPQSGLGIYFIEKYKVDPAKSIMVGDMKSTNGFLNGKQVFPI